MKRINLLLLILCSGWVVSRVNAQCTGILFTTSADTVPCGGGMVTLAAFDSSSYALANDFNTGTAGPGWSVSPAGVFNNPCGAGPGGSTDPHMWMGSTTTAPRELATNALDLSLSCGADSICFDLKFATQGIASPCEGPDEPDEGVSLQYSLNGSTWNDIIYFHPNGTLVPTNPMTNTPSISGPTTFTTWGNYCFAIPPAAITAGTYFRWYQTGSSANVNDHWGIDNVVITAVNCNYYYDWANIPGSPDTNIINVNVLTDTTFTVLYTNGVDDTCTGSINLYVDTTVDYTLNVTSPSCNTSNDGTLQINPTSGAPTYTFNNFTTGVTNTTGLFTSLAPGWHVFDITDGVSGCYTLDSVFINNGPPLSYNVVIDDPSCDVTSDGSFTFNPTSGVGPYTYELFGVAGPQPGNSFSPIAPGNYSFEIVDANGCTISGSATMPVGPQIAVIPASTTATACPGSSSGSVQLNAYGNPSYVFNISGPTTASNSTGLFTGLPSGSYTVQVVDALGCVANGSFNIGTGPGITLTTNKTDELCGGASDGTISASSSGATPLTFGISGPSTMTNSSGLFTGLAPGTYTVDVTDANGCTKSTTVTINAGITLAGNASAVPTSCSYTSNGSATLTASNGTGPFTYAILGPGVSSSNSSGTFNSLPAGGYAYSITSSNGCIYTDSFYITSPAPVIADFIANPTMGVEPLTVFFTNTSQNAVNYTWFFGDGNTSTTGDPSNTYSSGTYTATLIAQNGACFDTAFTTIVVVYESVLIIPNVITPNGDGVNDVFKVTHSGIESFNCAIYNRWGTEVYRYNDVNGSWDGRIENEPASEGTYLYIINARGIEGKEYSEKGTVNVFHD